MSCVRCSKSHSVVQAFLLTCCGCNRKWHHRCHIPPVTDQELVLRIKAHNAGDLANGLHAWKCKRCTTGDATSVASTPAPQGPVAPQNNSQSVSRSSSAQGTTYSASDMSTVPADALHAPSSNIGRSDASRIRNHGGEASGSSAQPTSLPRNTTSKHPTRVSAHQDSDVIVIDDSDSDSSIHPISKTTKQGGSGSSPVPTTTSIRKPVVTKAIESIARPSKAIHPLAQEEEESSDTSNPPALPTQRRSQSTMRQRPISSTNPSRRQSPHPTVITGDDNNNNTLLHPSPPRKKLASGVPVTTGSKRMGTPSILSFQQDKETKRDQFRRNATDNEKRKRMEHRQRQQQLLNAKIEEREAVEALTSDVIDLDLNAKQQIQEQPWQPSIASEHPMPEQADLPRHSSVATPAAHSGVSAVEAPEDVPQMQRDMNLAPQWFHARTDDDDEDMWARALRKKISILPPSATRRKVKARKLGEARPRIYNFDILQWEERLKRAWA